LVPADWRPWQKAPAALGRPGTVAALEAERLVLEAALAPATEREFLVALDPVFRFARAFGVPADVKAATGFYWQELRGHPARAIAEAVGAVLGGWTNGFRLPMPQEIAQALPMPYRAAQATRWRVERAIAEIEAGRIETDDGETDSESGETA
jgi:hypothetical protein